MSKTKTTTLIFYFGQWKSSVLSITIPSFNLPYLVQALPTGVFFSAYNQWVMTSEAISGKLKQAQMPGG